MDVENRRKFFLEIAESLKFDPAVARNWKKVRTAHVVARKVYLCLSFFSCDMTFLELIPTYSLPFREGGCLGVIKDRWHER